MPQPTFVSTGVKFGGLAQPNGQGVLTAVNLNDGASWSLQDFSLDNVVKNLEVAQALYRAKGVTLSRDFVGGSIVLPTQYSEVPGTALGAALAQLAQAGEQNLTFDNMTTAILADFVKPTGRKLMRKNGVPVWELALEFFARNPFFFDVAPSTVAATAVAGTTTGSLTNFNVTYAGSVFAEPVWTLTVGAANPATIASIVLKNNMSLESMTINFPPLAALTAWTITIDCAGWTITDQNGTQYRMSGSAWPALYGPPGTIQQMAVTITTGTGTLSNTTIGAAYNNRWQA